MKYLSKAELKELLGNSTARQFVIRLRSSKGDLFWTDDQLMEDVSDPGDSGFLPMTGWDKEKVEKEYGNAVNYCVNNGVSIDEGELLPIELEKNSPGV